MGMMDTREILRDAIALVAATLVGLHSAADANHSVERAELSSQVVLVSEVEWSPLNPARGSKGPQAGALWGDRTGTGPSGFLVKFADGFSSPPHVHNVSYRGVVISGRVHNDDPTAAEMWMPARSFWTQPAGEAHITAARGETNLVYVEIEQGPYLVLPPDQAFDRGERPVNIHQSNLAWVGAEQLEWVDLPRASDSSADPSAAFLWGERRPGQLHGTLLQVPAGFAGTLTLRGSSLRAILVEGRLQYRGASAVSPTALEPGSYFSASGDSEHPVTCQGEKTCVLYVRAQGNLAVAASPHERSSSTAPREIFVDDGSKS